MEPCFGLTVSIALREPHLIPEILSIVREYASTREASLSLGNGVAWVGDGVLAKARMVFHGDLAGEMGRGAVSELRIELSSSEPRRMLDEAERICRLLKNHGYICVVHE